MTSEKMCDYLTSTGLYEKKELDLSYVKDMIDSDKTIPISDLVKRFIGIDKYYKGKPWNIRQILANIDIIIPVEDRKDIDIIIPVEDRKEKWEAKDNEQIIEKIKKMPNVGDTVYGIFRQIKIIPLTITGITFNEFGITLSDKNEEELGYSAITLMADNTGTETVNKASPMVSNIKKVLFRRNSQRPKQITQIMI